MITNLVYSVLVLVLAGSIAALLYAFAKTRWINRQPVENDDLRRISGYISEGAMAFLNREYKALVPFIYGMLLANPVWAHVFLLLGWFSLYLMTYPFLNLFKGKNLELYKKWSVIYFAAAVIFAIPALIYNWQVLYLMFAMLPFVAVNIYFTKKKDERNLWNDLAGILIFALAGMGSYYFSDRTFLLFNHRN